MDVNMIHTNAGLALLAKLEQGIPLRITRVCSGAGRSSDLPNMIALTDKKQELAITGQAQKGTQATIYVRLTNQGLKVGYDLTQIGVFAEDPDEGEILYRVAQFERAIPLSAEQDFPDYSVIFQIIDSISNASQVDVYIEPTGMVTMAQFQQEIAKLQAGLEALDGIHVAQPTHPLTDITHNLNTYPDAHVIEFSDGYGLGGYAEGPYGGGNGQKLRCSVEYLDYNRIRLLIEKTYLPVKEVRQVNEKAYLVTFTSGTLSLLVQLITCDSTGTSSGSVSAQASRVNYNNNQYPEIQTVEQGLDTALSATKDLTWRSTGA